MRTPLQPVSSLNSYPAGTFQIDLVGLLKLPVHRYVLTAIDVFTEYLFAVPLTNVRANTIAREPTVIFFRHSYLPKTILSDLAASFVSEPLHELTKVLEIQPKYASLKHPQRVGVVERSHSALKRILKVNSNEQWNDWFKYVQLATFIHRTSYHSAIGCSPTVPFQGHEPKKPLDLQFNNSLTERFSPNSEYVMALEDAMNKMLLTGNLQCALFHVRKVTMHLATLILTTLWTTPRETFLMHLSLNKDHSWNLHFRSP